MQNNKTEGVKQKHSTTMHKVQQEKIFAMGSNKCDRFIDDDVTDDTEIESDESSIHSDGSSISTLTDGTSKSNSSEVVVWARSYLHEKNNIVDCIPYDINNNNKDREIASYSMILRFVQTRRERMTYIHNDYCDEDDLNDIFRWAARKYPRENESNRITPDDIESTNSNWSPIDAWTLRANTIAG
jgi:hypothetical protein